MPNTVTAETQYANKDNRKIAYRKFGNGMNDLNTNAPKITTMTFKNVKTQTINVSGIDFYFRKLGENNTGVPVIFFNHLAATLDNCDPRIMDGKWR